MTRRRIEPPHIRRVTVVAHEFPILIERFQLLAHIQSQSILVMAFSAGGDGHVWLQTAQCYCLSDVDVAGGAFLYVLLARVPIFERKTFRQIDYEECFVGKLVAAGAVLVRRLLRFPVAVEACSVTAGRGFESCGVGNKRISPTFGWRERNSSSRCMANFTVVIVFRFVIGADVCIYE